MKTAAGGGPDHAGKFGETKMDERRTLIVWERTETGGHRLVIHTDWETDITSAEEWALIDAKAKELNENPFSVEVETRRDFVTRLQ